MSVRQVEDEFSRYAFPIVVPLRRAVDSREDDVTGKVKKLYETFESFVAYLAAVFTAECRTHGLGANNTPFQNALAGLSRPALGNFSDLLRESIRLFSKWPGAQAWHQECVEAFNSPLNEEHFAALCDLGKRFNLPIPKSAAKTHVLVAAIVTFRNNFSHTGSVDDDEQKRRVAVFQILLIELFRRFRAVAEFPLIETVVREETSEGDGTPLYRIRDWSGFLPNHSTWRTTHPLTLGRLYSVVKDDDGTERFVNLSPFWFPVRCSECRKEPEVGLINKVFSDAVLLDVLMPGINGIEVCRKIKEKRENSPPARSFDYRFDRPRR